MIAYKLFRKMKDGALAPLFINKKLRLEMDVWYPAEDHETKGYKHRPGWHSCPQPYAPHLSPNGRVWCMVEILDVTVEDRPASQGGRWYLSNQLRIIEEVSNGLTECKDIRFGV